MTQTQEQKRHADYMRSYFVTRPEQAERKRIRDQEYYRKNREHKLENQKKYYEENKEERQEYARVYGQNKRARRKIEAIAYLGGRCQECEVDDFEVLEFHHRDRSTKLFDVGGVGLTKPEDVFWIEVDKCDLLCANHHRKRDKEDVR